MKRPHVGSLVVRKAQPEGGHAHPHCKARWDHGPRER